MLISILCALATGRMQQLSDAVLSGAGDAVGNDVLMDWIDENSGCRRDYQDPFQGIRPCDEEAISGL